MTDRRVANWNVWHTDDDEVVLDFFGPDHDLRTVRREDADCGVVFTEQHAEWLVGHLQAVLREIRARRAEHEV